MARSVTVTKTVEVDVEVEIDADDLDLDPSFFSTEELEDALEGRSIVPAKAQRELVDALFRDCIGGWPQAMPESARTLFWEVLGRIA